MGRVSENSSRWPDDKFTLLVEQNFDDIWRYAYHRSRSEEDADDIVAHVLAVAWRRRSDMPEPPATRLWLFGVARRTLSERRRASRRRDRLQTKLRTFYSEPRQELSERTDTLWVALSRLGEKDREILLLRAWDELAVSEMAEMFSCSPNAMSLRLRKARSNFAKKMKTISQKDSQLSGHVWVDPKFGKEQHG